MVVSVVCVCVRVCGVCACAYVQGHHDQKDAGKHSMACRCVAGGVGPQSMHIWAVCGAAAFMGLVGWDAGQEPHGQLVSCPAHSHPTAA